MKSKKLIMYGICASLIMSSLMGCAQGKNATLASETITTVVDLTDKTVEAVETDDTLSETKMFSDRDKETGYDEINSVVITLSDKATQVDSNAVQVSGNTITIKDEGTYILRGDLGNGQIIVDAEKTDKLQLVLDGIQINNSSSAPIYIKQADKVFITLANDSSNTLSTEGEFIAIDDNDIDAVIYSKDDLTLNGEGSLVISTQYGKGIVSKDDLIITGGNYDITTSDHGLVGKDSIRIADGVFDIKALEDGINSKADLLIAGGTFQISAGDDGIHADLNLTISGGIIDILESEEGIEGETIDITGGYITLVALDDGINAANSSDITTSNDKNANVISANTPYIKISGGVIHINAQGDGVDSNGNIYITGGETYVSGPTQSGDSALDFDGTAEITGGIFVAVGSSGMLQNFGNGSSQGSILVTIPAMQNDPIILKDSAGKELITFTPEKQYSSVLISTPDILKDETYTITMGQESQAITMENIIYSPAGGMGGGRPGKMGGFKDNDGKTGNPPMGERPEFENGERPELPNGERPEPPNGERARAPQEEEK